jgi:HK97 family phage major capsid protein
MKFIATVFAILFLMFLPAVCVFPTACDAFSACSFSDLCATLGSLPLLFGVVAAKCDEKRAAEIRKEKSPKKLREGVAELNKEIQKHRDMINVDTYEWRQEDEDKMNQLFGERQLMLERAEFIETVERVTDDIGRQESDGGGGGRRDLRGNPDRPGRRETGPLTNDQRSDAANWAIARHLGITLSRDNAGLVQRASEGSVFNRNGRVLDVYAGRTSQEFKNIQRQLRSGKPLERLDTRALTVGDGTASAGLFGSEGFIPRIERAMLYFGPMMQICTVLQTNDGRDIHMPSVDDTGNMADIVGEAADVSAVQDPTIGDLEWKSSKLRSKKVLYSAESAEDSVFDLFALLTDLLGERIGRGANYYWTLGGTNITGAVPGATAGNTVTAASVDTAVTDDVALATALITLINSVDIAYQSAGAVLMCNQVHLTRLATLQDSAGRWMFSVKDGMDDSFKGRPIKINNHMISTLVAGRPFLYGDFSSYWARVVRQIRIRRFVELHGDNDQDAVQVFRRIGGRYANANAVKALVLT